MPEQLAASIRGQLRLAPWPRGLVWSMACVLPLCGIPAAAFAQSAPAALRACAAEPDSAKRLACYDREMARLSATPARPAAGPAEPDLASRAPPAPAPSSMPAPGSSSIQPRSSSSAPAQPAHTAVEKSASPETPAPHRFSPWKIFTGGLSARVTAHVASLDHSPNTMVLHLDNGQVWRQVGRASGDLSLRAGDSVTIEKHLGSYWLSSRYISNMQVRLEPQQAQ